MRDNALHRAAIRARRGTSRLPAGILLTVMRAGFSQLGASIPWLALSPFRRTTDPHRKADVHAHEHLLIGQMSSAMTCEMRKWFADCEKFGDHTELSAVGINPIPTNISVQPGAEMSYASLEQLQNFIETQWSGDESGR